MAAIIVSGIMLKKTKMFAGDPAPFVMELPAYHLPTLLNVLRSMWERLAGRSLKKQVQSFFFRQSSFGLQHISDLQTVISVCFPEEQIDSSILAVIGNAIAWIFAPLAGATGRRRLRLHRSCCKRKHRWYARYPLRRFGHGLRKSRTGVYTNSGYSFLVFNLFVRSLLAAIGAIKREMNNAKWTWFAIGLQCVFAYVVALMVNQFGLLFTGSINVIGTIAALAVLVFIIYMLFKPYKESNTLKTNVKISA